MSSKIHSTETGFGWSTFQDKEESLDCKIFFIYNSESKSVNIKVINKITSFVKDMSFQDFSEFIKWGNKLIEISKTKK